MKKKSLLPYSRPMFERIMVELEHTIAASSATISGGSDDTPYKPEVTPWGDAGFGYGKGDL